MTKKMYKNKRLLKALNSFRNEAGLPDIIIKRRKCLKCNKIFTSLGNWNRLCESCTRANKHEDTIEPYAVGKS